MIKRFCDICGQPASAASNNVSFRLGGSNVPGQYKPRVRAVASAMFHVCDKSEMDSNDHHADLCDGCRAEILATLFEKLKLTDGGNCNATDKKG
jgi:hypothetical protein